MVWNPLSEHLRNKWSFRMVARYNCWKGISPRILAQETFRMKERLSTFVHEIKTDGRTIMANLNTLLDLGQKKSVWHHSMIDKSYKLSLDILFDCIILNEILNKNLFSWNSILSLLTWQSLGLISPYGTQIHDMKLLFPQFFLNMYSVYCDLNKYDIAMIKINF